MKPCCGSNNLYFNTRRQIILLPAIIITSIGFPSKYGQFWSMKRVDNAKNMDLTFYYQSSHSAYCHGVDSKFLAKEIKSKDLSNHDINKEH